MNYTKSLWWVVVLCCCLLLPALIVACGGGSSSSDKDGNGKTAEADIGVIPMAATTVFRVTVHSVDGLPEASKFNLIGGQESTDLKNFGQQLENYVVDPEDSITLAIYDDAESKLGAASIDFDSYPDSDRYSVNIDSDKRMSNPGSASTQDSSQAGDNNGSVTLVQNNTTADYMPQSAVFGQLPQAKAVQIGQSGQSDQLARGVIEDVQSAGTIQDVEIPLICGGGATGPFDPGPEDGFFIINDVAIEFNYAFDNPAEFNNILRTKLIESGRSFDNMDLYFRLPGPNRSVINARTGHVVLDADLPGIYDAVVRTVNSNNPFDTAIAIVDQEKQRFGPDMLTETTVKEVQGACVQGAQSFYVKDEPKEPDPDGIEAIGQTFDLNTQHDSLILLILGDAPTPSNGVNVTIDPPGVTQGDTGVPYEFTFTATNIPSGIDEITFNWTFGVGAPGTGGETVSVSNGTAETTAEHTYTQEGRWGLMVAADRLDGTTLGTDTAEVTIGTVTPREETIIESCGQEYRKDGYDGITTDRFIISEDIPAGATFNLWHDARFIPDRYRVFYAGQMVLDTNWVGTRSYYDNDRNLYPGEWGGDTRETVENIFTLGATREFEVIVNGPDPSTRWYYRVYCEIN